VLPGLWNQPLSAAPEAQNAFNRTGSEPEFRVCFRIDRAQLFPNYFIAGGLLSVRVFVPIIGRRVGATDSVV